MVEGFGEGEPMSAQAGGSADRFESSDAGASYPAVMLWFRWKRLFGSYVRLISASLS